MKCVQKMFPCVCQRGENNGFGPYVLISYYLLGEPDLLRHCIYRSAGREEEREDNLRVFTMYLFYTQIAFFVLFSWGIFLITK